MMNTYSIIVATAIAATVPQLAQAQDQPSDAKLTPLQLSIACSVPPMTVVPGEAALHVIGAQDTIPRMALAGRDLLVIDAGTAKGVQLGQQYYVRRTVRPGLLTGPIRRAVHTAGWLRIVAANETTAIATVTHACDGIEAGDYLDPFVAPPPLGDLATIDNAAQPDFKDMGRVLFGDEEHSTAAAGDYMLIDRGTDKGLTPGARFAIYRDVHRWMQDDRTMALGQLPLASIGEGVVVTTGETMSVLRILSARDAVYRGDYVVPRTK
jgi:hypothetical protein